MGVQIGINAHGKSTSESTNPFLLFYVTNITCRRHYWPFWPPSGHFGGHIMSMEHDFKRMFDNSHRMFVNIHRMIDNSQSVFENSNWMFLFRFLFTKKRKTLYHQQVYDNKSLFSNFLIVKIFCSAPFFQTI